MYASANFKRLVLGCIKADVCSQIFKVQHFFEIYKIFTLLHRSKRKKLANTKCPFNVVSTTNF